MTKNIKAKLTDEREINIAPDDCVLIFKLNGKAHIFPSYVAMEAMEENLDEEFIEVPDNLVLLTALGHKLRDPDFIQDLHDTFDKIAAEEEAEYVGSHGGTVH
jgi:hypothetical protein